jgi:hypothetical protein
LLVLCRAKERKTKEEKRKADWLTPLYELMDGWMSGWEGGWHYVLYHVDISRRGRRPVVCIEEVVMPCIHDRIFCSSDIVM